MTTDVRTSPSTYERGEPPFDTLQVVHFYEVIDRAATSHRSVDMYRLQTRRRFRFFEHRYRWTGIGVEHDPRVLPSDDDPHSTDYRLHGPIIREGEFRVFLVDMARDLAPGEPATVIFEQDFVDRNEAFEPRLRKTVRTTIQELFLVVALPPELQSNVRSTVRNLMTEEPVGPPRPLDPIPAGSASFCVKVDTPLLGHRYAIEWM